MRFGVPCEVVTDRGTSFTSKLVQDLTKKYKIKHRTYTLYHSQANEQVESTNKVLEGIITKIVQSHKTYWENHLLEAF